MSLLEYAEAIPGSYQSQGWGVPAAGVASREPEMWSDGTKAYWPRPDGAQPFSPSTHYLHFHPGVDRAAPEDTPIHAREAGVVRFAGLKQDPGSDPPKYTSGIVVEVDIRPGTGFGESHCSRLAVAVGDYVRKGEVIAYVGSTGNVTGPHSHSYVYHLEAGRTFLYNPLLFVPGARLATVSWILPAAAPAPPPPPATAATRADGDPYPMRFRSDVHQGTGAVVLLRIKGGKPYRLGAKVSDPVAKTAPATGEPIVAVAHIDVADLPAAERPYGNVWIVPSYRTNGDHFFYVKAVDAVPR